jgi:hypothetical protein
MVALQSVPCAVIVIDWAAPLGAVHVTLLTFPLGGESVPPEVDQEAFPSENVKITASPTPTFKRARFAGSVATVWEVMLQPELNGLPLASVICVSAADLGVGLNFASGFHLSPLIAFFILPDLDNLLPLAVAREILLVAARFACVLLDDFNRLATAIPFDQSS